MEMSYYFAPRRSHLHQLMTDHVEHEPLGEDKQGRANPTLTTPIMLKFTSDRQHNLAFAMLNHFRQSEEFCDVILKVGSDLGQTIHAHRNVLASSSPYFRAMLTGGLAESTQTEIIIMEIDPAALRLLINFFYTSKLTINESNVQNLFVASCLLQVDEVKTKCAHFLMTQLSPSNCLGIRALGATYSCPSLFTTADLIVKRQFEAVIATEEFRELPLDIFVEIVKSDDFHVDDDEIIFNAVVIWVKNKPSPERCGLFRQFNVHVRKAKERLLRRKSLKRQLNPDEIGGEIKKPRIEEIPRLTGFDLGHEPEKIVNKKRDEQTGVDMVTMKWKGIEDPELVPVHEVRLKSPQLYMDYLEHHLAKSMDWYNFWV